MWLGGVGVEKLLLRILQIPKDDDKDNDNDKDKIGQVWLVGVGVERRGETFITDITDLTDRPSGNPRMDVGI